MATAAPRPRRRAGNRLRIKVEENVSRKIKALQGTMRSPLIAKALTEGAQMIAQEARANAPTDTGQMQRGVYVTSIISNEYRPLVRSRNGQRLNVPLRNPPRLRQALVISSVFYTRFVEGGRAVRATDASRGVKHERRGTGRMKKRPFFQRAKRKMRKPAQAHVQRRLVQIIEGSWRDG